MHRPRFGGVFVDGGRVGLKIPEEAPRGSAVDRARAERVPAPRLRQAPHGLCRGRPRRARYQPGIRMTLSASGAVFSKCRRWRYLLWRRWDEKRPAANFLMLNPSTADETQLDPSCTRAREYASRWGFGGLLVTNLFAWRATDPEEMKAARDPVGRGNDRAILRAAREAAIVVCAWGNHGTHVNRSLNVLRKLRGAGLGLHVLRMNGSGEPAHPLYLPARLEPGRWRAK